jgi:hypothetical protein
MTEAGKGSGEMRFYGDSQPVDSTPLSGYPFLVLASEDAERINREQQELIEKTTKNNRQAHRSHGRPKNVIQTVDQETR